MQAEAPPYNFEYLVSETGYEVVVPRFSAKQTDQS